MISTNPVFLHSNAAATSPRAPAQRSAAGRARAEAAPLEEVALGEAAVAVWPELPPPQDEVALLLSFDPSASSPPVATPATASYWYTFV